MKTLLFVLEIDPMQAGQAYQRLALHCTVMHRFKTESSVQGILAATHVTFAQTPPIQLEIGSGDIFGPSGKPKTISVNHVKKTSELGKLHLALYDTLNRLSVAYTEPGFVGKGYTPHVSEQNGKRLSEGQTRTAHAIYLVEILNKFDSKSKYVHARIPLAGS